MSGKATDDVPPVVGLPNGNGNGAAARHGREPSVRELTAELSVGVARLARAEARLALAEIRQRAKRTAAGATMFGAAGLAAFFGSCCLVVALVLGLCNVMRPWFAALVTAAALFLLALFIALPGWKGFKGGRPVTTDVAGSLKADVDAVRNAVQR